MGVDFFMGEDLPSGSTDRAGHTEGLTDGHTKKEKRHIQKGLQNIGYTRGFDANNLALQIDQGNRVVLPIIFQTKNFEDVYNWTHEFVTNLIDKLNKRFEEPKVWKGLRMLMQPDIWRTSVPPAQVLGYISNDLKEQVLLSELQQAWSEMQPEVLCLLRQKKDVRSCVFKANVLLPAMAKVTDSKLRTLIVVAAATCGNNAQMERDMKTLRDLWHKRSKKLCREKVISQMRISLNHTERSGQSAQGRALGGEPLESTKSKMILRSLANNVKAAWECSGQERRAGKTARLVGTRDGDH